MRNGLAASALIVAVVALLLHLAGAGASREAGSSTAVAPDLGPLEARIEALEREQENLREIVERLRLVPAAGPEREPAATSDPKLDELVRRVADLEQRVPALAEVGAEALTDAERAEFLRRYVIADDLQQAIERAQDLTASEEERLEALRRLRGQRDPTGIDARLYVLDSMLELARTSQDGEVRADVWRQLNHVEDPRLRQPLLDTLAYDLHAKAREEAAETLADFLPDVAVEAALRAAMENDLDAGVRRQAAASLAEKR